MIGVEASRDLDNGNVWVHSAQMVYRTLLWYGSIAWVMLKGVQNKSWRPRAEQKGRQKHKISQVMSTENMEKDVSEWVIQGQQEKKRTKWGEKKGEREKEKEKKRKRRKGKNGEGGNGYEDEDIMKNFGNQMRGNATNRAKRKKMEVQEIRREATGKGQGRRRAFSSFRKRCEGLVVEGDRIYKSDGVFRAFGVDGRNTVGTRWRLRDSETKEVLSSWAVGQDLAERTRMALLLLGGGDWI